MRLILIALFYSFAMISNSLAGNVQIVNAKVTAGQDGRYGFAVTLRHADNGWEHYADRWDVLPLGGAVLGSRVLMHPYEVEQPFTRSLPEGRIPQG